MNFRRGIAATAVLLGAVGASIGFTEIRAAQDPLLRYCPSHIGGTDCATAARLFLQFGNPTDDELVTLVKVIAAKLGSGYHSRTAYASTITGLGLLARAIDGRGQRNTAVKLVNALAFAGPGETGDSSSSSSYGYGSSNHSSPSGTGGGTGGHSSSGHPSSSGSSGQSSGSSGIVLAGMASCKTSSTAASLSTIDSGWFVIQGPAGGGPARIRGASGSVSRGTT